MYIVWISKQTSIVSLYLTGFCNRGGVFTARSGMVYLIVYDVLRRQNCKAFAQGWCYCGELPRAGWDIWAAKRNLKSVLS